VDIIQYIENKHKKPEIPSFNVGDTVDVQVMITEGNKERIQIFSGVVIAMKGKGINRAFTVRRIVQGEGVERTFPFHSPKIGDVKIKKRGSVRRAKLYYLRERTGKGARIKEQVVTSKKKKKAAKKAAPPAPEAPVKEAPESTTAEAEAAAPEVKDEQS